MDTILPLCWKPTIVFTPPTLAVHPVPTIGRNMPLFAMLMREIDDVGEAGGGKASDRRAGSVSDPILSSASFDHLCDSGLVPSFLYRSVDVPLFARSHEEFFDQSLP
ncbi:hypothetical protein BHM03_00005245 [Ensete ventricosum]|nr:hypothetical protein BHM03_00005245 [Ensete ventricosum]